ncbi:PLANT CADMIUM RESISTANCE 2 [Spatholobus suberectus]|nr:PLANT CADMIUM RESISTANCE 2 [Spatholobus suberectus]
MTVVMAVWWWRWHSNASGGGGSNDSDNGGNDDACTTTAALYLLVRVFLLAIRINCAPGPYSGYYRSRMRKQYGLRGDDCTDCLVHCFCEPCALCQEYRELENRGFNMSIGRDHK